MDWKDVKSRRNKIKTQKGIGRKIDTGIKQETQRRYNEEEM